MSKTAQLTRSLFHPATLIAILALIVAMSSAAYAIVITGADVKDGSLSGADIKSASIPGADLKSDAKGARAVATVWGDVDGCYLITATSRGFLGCARDGVGDYSLTLKPGISLANTYPICSRGSNGGFNTLYQFSCDVGPFSATKVRVRLTRVPETATTGPEAYDAAETIPFVVVIP